MEILEAIKKLKPKLSLGFDGTPRIIVKGCAKLFAPLLEHIFNLSLWLGAFASSRETSATVPAHKSGDVCGVRDLETNFFALRLFKKISKVSSTYTHLSHYFRQKMSFLQHGFRKGRSGETVLSFITSCHSLSVMASWQFISTCPSHSTKCFCTSFLCMVFFLCLLGGFNLISLNAEAVSGI